MKLSIRTRIAGTAIAIAIVGAGAFGAAAFASDGGTAPATPAGAAAAAPADAPTSALDKSTTTASTHLTIEAATEAAQAALDAAEKDGQRVTVAVVDRNGNTIAVLRGDGAGPQAYESAIRRAYTAVAWNAPTSELAQRLESAPNLKDIPNTLFLAGGVPVADNKAPIAGIGVAGAPSGDLDEQFAQAGLDAISH